ncbi:hypothetical protein ABK040_002240 [Willaertia magna]
MVGQGLKAISKSVKYSSFKFINGATQYGGSQTYSKCGKKESEYVLTQTSLKDEFSEKGAEYNRGTISKETFGVLNKRTSKKEEEQTTIVLLKDYKEWSSSEVIALLKMNDNGCGLLDNDIAPLEKGNFSGIDIDCIINYIHNNNDVFDKLQNSYTGIN